MKLPLLLRAGLVLAFSFLAQDMLAQTPIWGRSGGCSQTDIPPISITDTDGSVYLGGTYNPVTTIGDSAFSFTNGFAGRPDFFIAKYTADCALEWIRHGGGTNQDRVTSLFVDSDGSIYATISFFEDFAYQDTAFPATVSFDADLALMKLDADGNRVWIRKIASDGIDWVNDLVVRADGIYMHGQFQGTLRLDSTHSAVSAGDYDVFWAKYNLSGDPQWVRTLGGQFQDNPGGMALDRNGDLVSVGTFYTSVTVGSTTLQSSGQQGSYMVKFSSGGTLIWAQAEASGIIDVALDQTGNIYAAGNFSDSQSFGPYPITSRGQYDGFVVKFNPNGVALWARGFGGAGTDAGYTLAYTPGGLVYIAGLCSNGVRFGALPAPPFYGSFDGFVVAYTTAGDAAWAYTFGGGGEDQASTVSLDPIGGGLFVTGSFADTCRLGPNRVVSRGGQDWCLFKIDVPTATKPLLPTLSSVYPNPAGAGSTVTLSFPTADPVLIDATGASHPLRSSLGTMVQLPEGLAPGLYRILSEGRSVPIVVK